VSLQMHEYFTNLFIVCYSFYKGLLEKFNHHEILLHELTRRPIVKQLFLNLADNLVLVI
jgi:hypothetical protein